MNKNDSVKTILILGANPTDTTRVRLEQEINVIEEALRRSDQRHLYKLEKKLGVSSLSFYQAILDYKPQIIHFCGHGVGEDGIILENDKGKKVLMETATLASWFQSYAQMGLECLILNTCYSEVQAEVISQYVDYVLGMKKAVGDEDAISFSRAFYNVLFSGCEVERAYNLTRSMIDLKQETLVLKKQPSFIERLIKPMDEVNNKQPLPNENNQFNWDKIPFNIIREAYAKSLPPSVDYWEYLDTTEKIIEYLKKYVLYDCFLITLSENKDLDDNTCSELVKLASLEKIKKGKKKVLKPYLIVSIKPNPDRKNLFRMKSWLFEDDSLPRNNPLDIKDINFEPIINENPTEAGLVCDFEKIPEKFGEILEEALNYFSEETGNVNLTIEFFLPKDLMCIAIEKWKIYDPIVKELSIGTEYVIHLRSIERQCGAYWVRKKTPWLEKWKQLRTILDIQEQSVENFYHQKEINFDSKDLQIELDTKIGLKATCTLTTDIIDSILLATTPIAIWTRCSLPYFDSEIDNVLFTQPLNNLCESIRILRKKARDEQDLGNHLVLIWENPYRLTPDAIDEILNIPKKRNRS